MDGNHVNVEQVKSGMEIMTPSAREKWLLLCGPLVHLAESFCAVSEMYLTSRHAKHLSALCNQLLTVCRPYITGSAVKVERISSKG